MFFTSPAPLFYAISALETNQTRQQYRFAPFNVHMRLPSRLPSHAIMTQGL